MLTDKNHPLRTHGNTLPLKANAKLVVNNGGPRNCDDKANVRVDAPCATTKSEAICCHFAANIPICFFGNANISGAFLSASCTYDGQGLPRVQPGMLVRIRKGVFGLPTAPRLGYLEVVNSRLKLGLEPSRSDPRFMVLHDNRRDERSVSTLCGCVCIHVDDFL